MVPMAPLSSWARTVGGQVHVGEHVARDDEEPLVELLAGVQDRACRAERGRLGRVRHVNAELRAVAEVVADGVGHEGDGDDHVLEAVAAQQSDDVLHHRPVRERKHRLRLVRGEGPAAGSPRRRP